MESPDTAAEEKKRTKVRGTLQYERPVTAYTIMEHATTPKAATTVVAPRRC
jgi:hypothetical protein